MLYLYSETMSKYLHLLAAVINQGTISFSMKIKAEISINNTAAPKGSLCNQQDMLFRKKLYADNTV